MGDSGSDGGGGDKTSVTFLPKNLGNPYFDVTARGGEAAVKEFGGTFDQVGPQDIERRGVEPGYQALDFGGR